MLFLDRETRANSREAAGSRWPKIGGVAFIGWLLVIVIVVIVLALIGGRSLIRGRA